MCSSFDCIVSHCIPQVASARQALSSTDLPGQAQKLEQAVLPVVQEVSCHFPRSEC
jgi:hypothetical protein